MKNIKEIIKEQLLSGTHLNKFDLLRMCNSVCLAQRILDIRQEDGWNIVGRSVPNKGNLKEYWLPKEEIERINKWQQGKDSIGSN